MHLRTTWPDIFPEARQVLQDLRPVPGKSLLVPLNGTDLPSAQLCFCSLQARLQVKHPMATREMLPKAFW